MQIMFCTLKKYTWSPLFEDSCCEHNHQTEYPLCQSVCQSNFFLSIFLSPAPNLFPFLSSDPSNSASLTPLSLIPFHFHHFVRFFLSPLLFDLVPSSPTPFSSLSLALSLSLSLAQAIYLSIFHSLSHHLFIIICLSLQHSKKKKRIKSDQFRYKIFTI